MTHEHTVPGVSLRPPCGRRLPRRLCTAPPCRPRQPTPSGALWLHCCPCHTPLLPCLLTHLPLHMTGEAPHTPQGDCLFLDPPPPEAASSGGCRSGRSAATLLQSRAKPPVPASLPCQPHLPPSLPAPYSTLSKCVGAASVVHVCGWQWLVAMGLPGCVSSLTTAWTFYEICQRHEICQRDEVWLCQFPLLKPHVSSSLRMSKRIIPNLSTNRPACLPLSVASLNAPSTHVASR